MLNKEQQEVVDSTADKILVLAGAGTGKTHCMLERIKKVIRDGATPTSILVLTFTNAAAYNMDSRFKGSGTGSFRKLSPEFKTFHAFCYSLIASNLEVRKQLGYSKVPNIILDAELLTLKRTVKEKYNIKLSDAKLSSGTCLSKSEQFQFDLYKKCLKRELIETNKITFDMLCYDVCELFVSNHTSIRKYFDQYKYIFVDEFQDTDLKQWKFVQSFKNSKIYIVGDALQCQPAGTKITMADMTEKNIEDLVPGDFVLSYSTKEGHYLRNLRFNSGNLNRYTKQVTAISKHYATNVVRITSETHSSRYTLDHITYAKIHYEGNETSYVTYLMQGLYGRWRVGSTKLFLKCGKDFGVRQRLRAENGIAAWILGVYDNWDDAWLNEQIVSYKFGIPQTTWVCKNVRYTDEDLDKLYETLGDLSENAERCLNYYHRYIEYPMFTKVDNLKHFSKLHMFESRVCNLIPGVFDVVFPEEYEVKPSGKKLHNVYEVIKSITEEPDQYVYGLDVEYNHNYVADGLLTHNCLYTFRGADSSIIKSLAVNPEWTTYRLHRNYRSTVQICDYANENSTYANDNYRVAIDTDREGDSVTVMKIHDSRDGYDQKMMSNIKARCKNLQDGDTLAVLCRTNAEVYDIKEYLINQGIQISNNDMDKKLVKNLMLTCTDDYQFLKFLSSELTNEDYAEYLRIELVWRTGKEVEENEDSFDIQTFLTFFQNKGMSKAIKLMNQIHSIMWNTDYNYLIMYSKLLDLFHFPYKKIDPSTLVTVDDLINAICDVIDNLKDDTNIYVGTIHSSKGLEYDEVHLVNVGGKSFRVTSEDNHNVFYVGITRAKNQLFVYEVL